LISVAALEAEESLSIVCSASFSASISHGSLDFETRKQEN